MIIFFKLVKLNIYCKSVALKTFYIGVKIWYLTGKEWFWKKETFKSVARKVNKKLII